MNNDIAARIQSAPSRSAWARGVKQTALKMLESLDDGRPVTKESLLKGAKDWKDWAWGGCGLIYDADIAERYCSPSELKRTRGGELRPNSREEWLDVEARAAGQAAALILRAAHA